MNIDLKQLEAELAKAVSSVIRNALAPATPRTPAPIRQPKEGGKCRAIWDTLDAVTVEKGEGPALREVLAMAEQHGWKPGNARSEFYRWRHFRALNKIERRQGDRRTHVAKLGRRKDRRVSGERRVQH